MTEIASALKRRRLRAVVKARPVIAAEMRSMLRRNNELIAEANQMLAMRHGVEMQRISVH